MERPQTVTLRSRPVPKADYDFISPNTGENDVTLEANREEGSLLVKENTGSSGSKPDYLQRIWYLAVGACIFLVVLCVFAGVAMGYIISNQGLEAMESVRDMRVDTRQLHDAVMEGKKMADSSMVGMLADAKDAIHTVAELLRKNPDTVQQTLAQANALASRVQELTAKFTPEQMDAIKQNVMDITRATKDTMAALNPAVLNATISKFIQLATHASDFMAKMQAENLLRDAAAFAEMGTSLGQRIMDLDQIVVNLPKFNKRVHTQ